MRIMRDSTSFTCVHVTEKLVLDVESMQACSSVSVLRLRLEPSEHMTYK